MADPRLRRLAELGQSPWIDALSRTMLERGELERLRDDGIAGVTSNPTILDKAIGDGDAYDDQLRELARDQDDPKELFIALIADDIRAACDVLAPSWDDGAGRDGWVSFEVSPTLAHDTDATIAEAERLHDLIDRPNLYVKIPATPEGLPAIEETIAKGIPVNVTLIFSLARHRAVAEAYVRGVERLIEAGGDPRGVASVASFFVSRVDTETDRRLDQLGADPALKGKLAIANAKLAYRTYEEVFSGEHWEQLAAAGASPQRCLWASTSTKNPDYRDTYYVEELVGPETVNTMPPATIDALRDHGEIALTLTEGLDEAQDVFVRIETAGVDYDDVALVLERDGVERFAESFEHVLETVAEQRTRLTSGAAS